MICKRDRKALYRLLSKQLGDPTKLSRDKRQRLHILLGGWLNQHTSQYERRRISNSGIPQSYRAAHYFKDTVDSIYEKHATAARWACPQPNWHWKVDRLVHLPKQNDINARLGVPAMPLSANAPPGMQWDWIHKGVGKNLQIMVPVNYHLTVHKQGLCTVDRKIVQRIWNHRVYSDKQVWECTYWDFSRLGKEEATWQSAKWKQGFVVKMDAGISVEESLTRALSLAQSRVVRAGINSILSDTDD